MDPQQGNDILVSSQQRVFDHIKRSHRLFVAQLYVAMLFIPLLAIFLLVFAPYLQLGDALSDLMSMLPFLAIFGILSVKQVKEAYSFFRSSGRYFHEIEHATDPSQISRGLTTYINHFVKLLQPPTLLAKPPATLPERLEHVESHMKKGLYLFIIEFAVSGLFIAGAIVNFLIAYPEILGQPQLYIVLAGFIVIPGIRLRLFLQWRPLVKRWLLGFQELVAWGENLEQIFLQQQKVGGHSQ